MNNKTSTAAKTLIRSFFELYPGEAARLLETFSAEETVNYLQTLQIAQSAQIFTRLNSDIAANIIESMDDSFFRQLFTAIDPSLAGRLLARLNNEIIEKQLLLLPENIGREIKELMQYPAGTAGHLMEPRALTFHIDDNVEQALKTIRNTRDRRILHIYIVDEDGKLEGIVPLEEIAVSQPKERLGNLGRAPFVAIQAMSPRDDVVQLLEEKKLISLPVVDIDGRLLGIIRHNAMIKATAQNVTEDLQAMFGAGRDERALSKVSLAIRKRLPWLEINLVTAFLAAAVVGLFEETIAKITILAVFLPVVAGQSGNTGSQALAVTMRGLALREIRTRHWFKVARKEIIVGFLNGCAVALTTSLIVLIWAKSIALAAVIAVAMVISMAVAGLSGAVIPIMLKAIGQDPAQSSSIILTTVTDVVGFISFLGLATLFAGIIGSA
ncbi:MAG: magnesium transporter [Calditrichaeota bacterium]|nr:MAG: magnesium transporter [Calditrichota bacterium]